MASIGLKTKEEADSEPREGCGCRRTWLAQASGEAWPLPNSALQVLSQVYFGGWEGGVFIFMKSKFTFLCNCYY